MHGYSKAFTIVELVMVIVILGILAAVAIPRFFDRRDFDERLYLEELLSAVRYAQKLALASGCQVNAVVTAGGGYQLLYNGQPANCPQAGTAVQSPTGGNYSRAAAPSGLTGSGSNLSLVFDSIGERIVPAGNADANVAILRSSGGGGVQFNVQRNGHIRI
ncbi:prepilin-type N-terminal cleavage/methylation domain-containing protein [Stutzerimonas kirkiae]|uniref:prepilin-type N-terminal cleavage/methylation domain-containing protein n=1 Tax=Stutzerimonas kirkiae TaxID=2211392 RepID=UPI0010384107|nr:prepilin-type N-terminal cleavage/methylation domain-containing protein [Stutzerimonas kirkiae]TBV17466.1 prepilin-type cleavage/methylation domain-containing protein [Stutzerimonas kirkiae]